MKNLTKKQKIIMSIVAIIIIAGIAVVAFMGFNFDLRFQTAQKLELYLGEDFKIADIQNITKETMPNEERGNIGMIKPSGWHTIKYDNINGLYLYNRCHLIGYQLTGENANEKNLITCTRQMNTGSMLEFENKVSKYINTQKKVMIINFNNEIGHCLLPQLQKEGYIVETDKTFEEMDKYYENLIFIDIDNKTIKNKEEIILKTSLASKVLDGQIRMEEYEKTLKRKLKNN